MGGTALLPAIDDDLATGERFDAGRSEPQAGRIGFTTEGVKAMISAARDFFASLEESDREAAFILADVLQLRVRE